VARQRSVTAPEAGLPEGFVPPSAALAPATEPRMLLIRLADALNACEAAGLRPKLRHGGMIATRAGFVLPPLDHGRWTTAFPSAAEPDGEPDHDEED
jgi:hypothetical protein